jgi:ubiquitin-protein ligase
VHLLAGDELIDLAPESLLRDVLNDNDVVVGALVLNPSQGNAVAPAPAPLLAAAPEAPSAPVAAPAPLVTAPGEASADVMERVQAREPVWLLGTSADNDVATFTSLRIETLHAAPLRVHAPLVATLAALTSALLPLLVPSAGDDADEARCGAGAGVTVFVMLDGRTLALTLRSTAERVSALAALLAARAPLPRGRAHRLQYGGRFLSQACATLDSYGVEAGSTVFASLVPAPAAAAEAPPAAARDGAAGRESDDGDDSGDADGDAVAPSAAAAFAYACVDLDLFTTSHGLYATPESAASATLREWGLPAASGSGGDVTLYGVLRQAPARHSGAAQTQVVSCFDAGCAWQPDWRPELDQSVAGTSAALCALRSLAAAAAGDAATLDAAVAALRAAVPFPPAVAALRAALRGRVLRDADKGALAAALHRFFRSRVPAAVQSDARRLFEHAPACLAALLALPPPDAPAAVDAEGGGGGTWRDAPLHDASLTHLRLQAPVRLRRGDGTLGATHSRANLLRKLPGGDLFLPGGPYDGATPAQMEPDADAAALLLAHPAPALEAQLWQPGGDTEVHATAAEEEPSALTPAAWDAATAAALACARARPLRQLPPMALKRAAAPALTRGADSLLRVYTGPVECSAKLSLYDPIARRNEAVDADELAAALGDTRRGDAADDRVPEEVLVVCIDTSNSMGDVYAADDNDSSDDDDDGDDEPLPPEPGVEAMRVALDALRASPDAPLLHTLAVTSTRHRDGVTALLSTDCAVLRAMLAPGRGALAVRVMAVLAEAAASAAAAAAQPQADAEPDVARATVPTHCVHVDLPERLVRTGLPAQLTLPAAPSYTVATLVRMLQTRTGAAPNDQILRKQCSDEASSAQHLDMDATLEAAGLRSGARLTLTLTPGARIPPFFAARRPEPLHVRITPLDAAAGRAALPLELLCDAGWSARRLVLEAFRARPSWAPQSHALLAGVESSGDGWYSYEAAASAVSSANRPLRTLFATSLSRGAGRSAAAPLELRASDEGTPAANAAAERRKARNLTRMAAVQQLFGAFTNRLAAFDVAAHVGLIAFGSQVTTMSGVTPLFERFIRAVNRTEPAGDTALWDALSAGVDMAAEALPGVTPLRRRLLVLTDGEDSCSRGSASALVRHAAAAGVVVDAILLGDAAAPGGQGGLLRAVTHASGGLCFAPASLRDAMRQIELETLLSSGERAPPPRRSSLLPASRPAANDTALLASHGNRGTLFTRADVVPPRRADPALALPARHSAETLAASDAGSGAPPGASARPAANVRKIVQELRAVTSPDVMGAEFASTYDVYPCADDVGFWRVVLQGRSDTPYAGGTWLLSVRFPTTYPAHPPAVRFETPILHANVNAYGRICAALLGPEWADGGGTRMPSVLRAIDSLFAMPETANPVNSSLALDFYTSGGVYEVTVAEHVAAHAVRKTRTVWRRQLLGGGDGSDGDDE